MGKYAGTTPHAEVFPADAEGNDLLEHMAKQLADVKKLDRPRTNRTWLDEVTSRVRELSRKSIHEISPTLRTKALDLLQTAEAFRPKVMKAIEEEKATQDKIIAESKARQKERNQASALAAEKRGRSAIKAFMKSEK